MPIQSKHFVNDPSQVVLESLEGLCSLNPQISLDVESKVVHVTNPDLSKVALICGGGSGHEPAHAGFVGSGMLNAAVCGNVFASPNAKQVRKALNLVSNNAGTVIVVKNYTGDVLNFGLAKEQHAAQNAQAADSVRLVIVGDDVAVGRTQGSMVGRRGLAGTVLVYKIAGALARRSANLDEVARVADFVASRVGTVGVGQEHVHVPGSAAGDSHLSSNEIEIGMGIHNESGARRATFTLLTELIEEMSTLITSTSDPERSFLPFKGHGRDRVVLLVNNLGSVSELELAGIVRAAKNHLASQDIHIERVLSGTFMTSLNMPGFSITLLLLPSDDDQGAPSSSLLLSLLDESADVPGWKWTSGSPSHPSLKQYEEQRPSTNATSSKAVSAGKDSFVEAIRRACRGLVDNESVITKMDQIAGDGDCGLTLKSGAEGVLAAIQRGDISGDDVARSFIAIANVAEEDMGGTSGALHAIYFAALAQHLQNATASADITPQDWADALSAALARLYTYTRARPPSRTLVDPLAAFTEAWSKDNSNLDAAVHAASEAAEKTKDLEAMAGRSAYVEGERLRAEQVADPGAWGVKVVLEKLLERRKVSV